MANSLDSPPSSSPLPGLSFPGDSDDSPGCFTELPSLLGSRVPCVADDDAATPEASISDSLSFIITFLGLSIMVHCNSDTIHTVS